MVGEVDSVSLVNGNCEVLWASGQFLRFHVGILDADFHSVAPIQGRGGILIGFEGVIENYCPFWTTTALYMRFFSMLPYFF